LQYRTSSGGVGCNVVALVPVGSDDSVTGDAVGVADGAIDGAKVELVLGCNDTDGTVDTVGTIELVGEEEG